MAIAQQQAASNVVQLRPAKTKKPKVVENPRMIVTDFFKLTDSIYPVWRNRSKHPRNASKNAQDYLHENTHGNAWIAVVWNEEIGRLICIWRRDVNGNVHSMYTDDPYDPKVLTDFPPEWLEFAPKN
jgi:hypothetical protein